MQETKFQFAGFGWPRHVVELPKGRIADRLAAFKCGERREASPYYHAPAPLARGTHPGRGFYHDAAGLLGMRWQWADEVEGARIDHTGWFTSADCGDKLRGVVLRLPHGRGFLYGWSMGEGMAATVEGHIWPGDDEAGAAHAADRCAELAAENERDYQERADAARALDDKESEALDRLRLARAAWRVAFRGWLDAKACGADVAAAACYDAMERHGGRFADAMEDARSVRAELADYSDVER